MTWLLPVGAAGSPLIRRLGQIFLALSGIMVVAWSAELSHDLWVNQKNRATIILVAGLAWVWCFQVGRLWRLWSGSDAVLRLHWTGDTSEEPHWRLIEWGQAVSVRVACDFQSWILLDVKSAASDGAPSRSVWFWVRGQDDSTLKSNSSLATAHRLRALLYMARRDKGASHSPQGPAVQSPADRQSLASWAAETLPGSILARTDLPRTRTSKDRGHAAKDPQARAWLATEFQQTQFLPPGEFLDADAATPRAASREAR